MPGPRGADLQARTLSKIKKWANRKPTEPFSQGVSYIKDAGSIKRKLMHSGA